MYISYKMNIVTTHYNPTLVMRNRKIMQEVQVLYDCYNAITNSKTFQHILMSPLSPPFNVLLQHTY